MNRKVIPHDHTSFFSLVMLEDDGSLNSLYYLGYSILESLGDLMTEASEKSISFKKYSLPLSIISMFSGCIKLCAIPFLWQ